MTLIKKTLFVIRAPVRGLMI